MTCDGCVKNVTNGIKRIKAIRDVKVTLDTGDVAVLYDPNVMNAVEIYDAVQHAIEQRV
jgi:copper chaperone CopZ